MLGLNLLRKCPISLGMRKLVLFITSIFIFRYDYVHQSIFDIINIFNIFQRQRILDPLVSLLFYTENGGD